ncbi:MAG: hypothetical protein R3D55_13645 [Chloroflexota bacterium]
MANRWRWLIVLMVLGCLLPISAVWAHGGGELLVGNAPIGSYLVSVWVNPPTVQTGQVIHVTVGIAAEGTGEPVLDAVVDVQIVDAAGQTVATAVATTEQSVNRLFYEADLSTLPVGVYEMQVMVAGRAGSGDVAFALPVTPRLVWPWVVGALLVVVLMVWLVRGWRRMDTAPVRRRGTAVPRRRSVD